MSEKVVNQKICKEAETNLKSKFYINVSHMCSGFDVNNNVKLINLSLTHKFGYFVFDDTVLDDNFAIQIKRFKIRISFTIF